MFLLAVASAFEEKGARRRENLLELPGRRRRRGVAAEGAGGHRRPQVGAEGRWRRSIRSMTSRIRAVTVLRARSDWSPSRLERPPRPGAAARSATGGAA